MHARPAGRGERLRRGISCSSLLGLWLLGACTPRGEAPGPEPDPPEDPPAVVASEREPAPPPASTGSIFVAAGVHHTCAVIDETVLCWGINRFGILGALEPEAVTAPRPVLGLEAAGPIALVAADYDFSCALAKDGGVWCWGDNEQGQLGTGDRDRRDRPTQVPGVSARAIALGFEHACALGHRGEQGEQVVWCWGRGDFSQGLRSDLLAPAEIPTLAGSEALAIPGSHGCDLRGTVMRCWGDNSSGQIGTGEGGCTYDEPLCADCRRLPSRTCARVDAPTVPLGLPAIVEIAASDPYSYARDGDGRIWQWGQVGQIMSADPQPQYRPEVVAGLPPVVEIGAGASHACARTEAGAMWCWGNDSFGQLGFEHPNHFDGSQPTPVLVKGLPPVRALAVGFYHTCAVTDADAGAAIWCWGDNGWGQLGDGSSERRHAPVPVRMP